jgi:uncharacterized protein
LASVFLDLKDLGLRGGDRNERTYSLELEPVVLGGAGYDVLLPEGVTVVVDRVAGGFLVTISTDARVYGPCVRCLAEVTVEVRAEQQEFAATARDGWEESDLSAFIEDMVVDVSSVAREAIVLALPGKMLCSPGCKGLCPQCGLDLNAGTCECTAGRGDERWAKLERLRSEDGLGS